MQETNKTDSTDDVATKMKLKWGKLSDADISSIGSNWQALQQKLVSVYGYSNDQAQSEIQAFQKENGQGTSSKDTTGLTRNTGVSQGSGPAEDDQYLGNQDKTKKAS